MVKGKSTGNQPLGSAHFRSGSRQGDLFVDHLCGLIDGRLDISLDTNTDTNTNTTAPFGMYVPRIGERLLLSSVVANHTWLTHTVLNMSQSTFAQTVMFRPPKQGHRSGENDECFPRGHADSFPEVDRRNSNFFLRRNRLPKM